MDLSRKDLQLLFRIPDEELRITDNGRLTIKGNLNHCTNDDCKIRTKCLWYKLMCDFYSWSNGIETGSDKCMGYRENKFPDRLNLYSIERWKKEDYDQYLEEIIRTYRT